MTNHQEAAVLAAITDAVTKAIADLGIPAVLALSWFPSSKRSVTCE